MAAIKFKGPVTFFESWLCGVENKRARGNRRGRHLKTLKIMFLIINTKRRNLIIAVYYTWCNKKRILGFQPVSHCDGVGDSSLWCTTLTVRQANQDPPVYTIKHNTTGVLTVHKIRYGAIIKNKVVCSKCKEIKGQGLCHPRLLVVIVSIS